MIIESLFQRHDSLFSKDLSKSPIFTLYNESEKIYPSCILTALKKMRSHHLWKSKIVKLF
jgi:hypothetical protein